jgi:periplasmic protein TonB
MSAAAALQGFKSSRRLWSVAIAAALSLHVAAFTAALLARSPELDDDATGAPAIEISLEPAAPHVIDAPDAPQGPLADEAAPAAPSVAASEAKESNEPRIARTEADDAEFTRDQRPDRPVEDTHAHQATPVLSNESIASEATAPPKSEVEREAPKPVAPAPGADSAARALKLTWQKALMAHLNRNKRYPAEAARRSVAVSIAFVLDRLGHVVSFSVKRSSGDRAFDDAALAMMKRADPVPAPPPVVADEGLSFDVPVMFRADRR